eukprot:TRINITY_DN106_c0_g2_i1.p1 TRINITY_DN106_c0_g2~~TRINITY_DN106_c0_g2_i1.p1  ORF type:complete len:753 (-),score=375.56 TRINITY_DN106_c0_g2_i1:22-2280(-)
MLSLAATRNRLVQLMGPTMRGMPSMSLPKGPGVSVAARGYSKDSNNRAEEELKKLQNTNTNTNKKVEEEDDGFHVPEALAEEFRLFQQDGLLSSERHSNVPTIKALQRDFDPDREIDIDFRLARRSRLLGVDKSVVENEYYYNVVEVEQGAELPKDEDELYKEDLDDDDDGEFEDLFGEKKGEGREHLVSGIPALKKGVPILEQVLSTADPTKSVLNDGAGEKDEAAKQDEEEEEGEEEEEEERLQMDPSLMNEMECDFWEMQELGKITNLPDTFYSKALVQEDEQKILDAAFMFQSLDTLDAVTENYEAKVKQQKAAKQVDAGKHFAETLKQRNQFDAQKIFLPDLSAQEVEKRKQLVEQFVQETAKTSKNVSASELNAFKQDLSNKILQAGADPVLILNNAKQQHAEKPFALECIAALLTNKDKLREIFEASTVRPRDLDFETYAASVKDKLEPSLRQMIFGFEANEDPSNPPVSGSVKGLTLADSFNTRRLFEALNPNMISLLQHYEAYPKQVKNWVKLFFTPRGVWNEEGRWEPVSGYRTLLTDNSRNLIDNVSQATSAGIKNHKEPVTQTTEKAAVVENNELYQTFDESFDIFAGNQEESRKSKTTLPKPKPIPADLVGQYRFGFTAEEVAPLPEKMRKLLTFAYASPREIKKHRIQIAREKWEQGPKDTGSPAAQVAMMTERLNAIAEHIRMFPRDLVAKRQNILLANKRKTVLKYLKRENITLYYSLIDSLSLRDVQALKPRNRK